MTNRIAPASMYHYTESGLANAWLANGFKLRQTRYGDAVAIDDVDGLHLAIAKNLVEKKGSLTGKEFRFLRTLMGMSQDGIAGMVGVQEQSVSLWERTGKVPKAQDALIRLIANEQLVKGNCGIAEVIERINVVERLVNQRIVARERGHKWTAKSSAMDGAGIEVATA